MANADDANTTTSPGEEEMYPVGAQTQDHLPVEGGGGGGGGRSAAASRGGIQFFEEDEVQPRPKNNPTSGQDDDLPGTAADDAEEPPWVDEAGYDDEEEEELLEEEELELLQQQQREDADNAAKNDGTRERNLTLWEASLWWQKVYAVFEAGSFPSDVPLFTERLTKLWAFFMFVVIVVSSLSVLFESYPEYQENEVPVEIGLAEVFSVVIFSFDMIVRFSTCPSKVKYALDVLNWVDLLAILPFYLTDIGGLEFLPELRMVRVLRLVRMLRVLRSRKLPMLNAVVVAALSSWSGLVLFLALAGIALLIASTSAYYAERGIRDPSTGLWYRDCPNGYNCTTGYRGRQISPFQSIPDSFWWATSALSSVGFGDVETSTRWGQFIASLTMLAGVFILAFPTMILSGNFDAARRFGLVVNHGWDVTRALRKKKDEDTPRSLIKKKLGWTSSGEPAPLGSPTPSQHNFIGASLSATASRPGMASTFRKNGGGGGGGKSMSNLRGASPASPAAVTPASFASPRSFTGTMRSPSALGQSASGAGGRRRARAIPQGPTAIGSFIHSNLPRHVYRNQRVDPHAYWYDPILALATCDDGGPSVRVIWGLCGMKTLVQLTLVVDDSDARDEAVKLVESFDQSGRVRCELGGGIEIRHFASSRPPAAAAAHPTTAPPGSGKDIPDNGDGDGSAPSIGEFVMHQQHVAGSWRNSDVPLYFEWTGDEADLMMMSEDELAEFAVSKLLGSSFHVNLLLPHEPVLKRLPIVQQVIHHTRLQRELELIAAQAEYGGDLLSYISRPDLEALLRGVHTKMIVEPGLNFEDTEQLEREIVDAVLARVREVRVFSVPKRCKKSIYNAELLPKTTVVYEFPMSLFRADEADEVEEDAIGYVHVRMRGYLSRTYRLDVRMDHAPPDLAYDDGDEGTTDSSSRGSNRRDLSPVKLPPPGGLSSPKRAPDQQDDFGFAPPPGTKGFDL